MQKYLILLLIICTQLGYGQQSPSIPTGVDSLAQLDRLPLLRRGMWFHSTSSQDVTGGNDDGFTAAFSDQYLQDGRYVLLDTLGPACVVFSWTSRMDPATLQSGFNGDVTIQTQKDGQTQKDVLPFGDWYSGRRAPFLAPLVRNELEGRGATTNYVPICSDGRIKISTDKGGLLLFYDIYYDT